MKLVVACGVLALLASLAYANRARTQQYLAEWEHFKDRFEKQYEDTEEENVRISLYLENRRIIDNHNAKYENGEVSYKMGVNQFTDMTEDEMRKLNGLIPSSKEISSHENDSEDYDSQESVALIPESKDWNKLGFVSTPRNQGKCGSCYAFAMSSLVESHVAIRFAGPNRVVPLSKQQIIDCSVDFGNHGCHGGQFDGTLEYIKRSGLEADSFYPYETRELGKCLFKRSSVAAKIAGYRRLAQDENVMRIYVAKYGPIAVAIQACESLSFYSGGIYDDPKCDGTNLNHAVLITGYGSLDGKDFWIIKNSWGTEWGEKGFFKVARGKGAIGLGTESFTL